jgi:hypothetical protein
MRSRLLILVVLPAALAAAGAAAARDRPASRPIPAARAQDLAVRLLAAHNRERAAVRVAPLRWDPALAEAAAGYAPRLAALGRLEHSPRNTRPGQSENLWMGSAGGYSPEQMVGNWALEKARFRAGIFPNVSTTGDWIDVSHYSQMIWPTTTSVGCALHRARRTDYLVCRYAPRGNQDGRRVP